ncbi:N-acetylgalactosamine-N,N'-diacetylbacillosaminyl-diphospho-undecaprenol 4-alpha-N-acetylgalactosaminyltransferase [bioreactor metagenome]|uniref:N-acetylgalactosamine-N, N'-diacetylbacillosaminyl-diphospho-undecaprenol 4-alpha-N-acetylgalactosaminyltransferase n=1 Tax=bioreactor metagenome TaxID=1076179 RepID=A0A645J0I5_9ZZZZ
MEKRIKELGVESTFKLLGFHKNPYKFVSKSDLYVCSSFREGFSTAVTEALVLGIPVVSTNCSGANELLGENNEFGIVTENSTEGLYEGIREMLRNPAKLSHYKMQAKARGALFSKEKTVKAVENLFDSLL